MGQLITIIFFLYPEIWFVIKQCIKCLGQFVIEYVGEMINEEEYRRRVEQKHQRKEENFYFLTIDKDRMLDAGPKGNVAR